MLKAAVKIKGFLRGARSSHFDNRNNSSPIVRHFSQQPIGYGSFVINFIMFQNDLSYVPNIHTQYTQHIHTMVTYDAHSPRRYVSLRSVWPREESPWKRNLVIYDNNLKREIILFISFVQNTGAFSLKWRGR